MIEAPDLVGQESAGVHERDPQLGSGRALRQMSRTAATEVSSGLPIELTR
jgi:hypothetical protein